MQEKLWQYANIMSCLMREDKKILFLFYVPRVASCLFYCKKIMALLDVAKSSIFIVLYLVVKILFKTRFP